MQGAASVARSHDQGWTLLQGRRHTFTADGEFAGPPAVFTEYRVAFPERADEISAVRRQPEEMRLSETLAYDQALRRQGIATPQYLVELHGRLAYALALHMNRHSGTTLALSLTLLGGFVYVILPNVMLALGYHGRLPPVVAAWTANSLFGGGGV